MTQKILNNYKKVGNKLISPMNQILNIKKTSWEDNILPELIWIALLIQTNGHNRGTSEIIEQIADFARINFPNNKILTCSDFSILDSQMKQKFLTIFSSEDLHIIDNAFRNFTYYFPDFPLSFLINKNNTSEFTYSLEPIKNLMREFIDKYSKLSTQVLAMAVYLLSLQGKLLFASGKLVPNIESVKDYPDTEESRYTAASLRAMSFTLVHSEDKINNWSNDFWIRSCSLDECE